MGYDGGTGGNSGIGLIQAIGGFSVADGNVIGGSGGSGTGVGYSGGPGGDAILLADSHNTVTGTVSGTPGLDNP